MKHIVEDLLDDTC